MVGREAWPEWDSTAFTEIPGDAAFKAGGIAAPTRVDPGVDGVFFFLNKVLSIGLMPCRPRLCRFR